MCHYLLATLNIRIRQIITILIPNDIYIKWQYKKLLGKKLDLKNPKTLNEKMQWLKLNWRDKRLTRCADKYLVRRYVADRCPNLKLNTLYGVFDSVEDINIDQLPDSFVLKVNHGSGQNIFCWNKKVMNWGKIRRLLKLYLKNNHYYFSREWAYKDIPPKILCEELLEDNGRTPIDYKFFCFDGEPKYFTVDIDRFGEHKENFYNLYWQPINLRSTYPRSAKEIEKPKCFPEMVEIAQKLSENMPFVRVDLCFIKNTIYFGEMTFYHYAGFEKLEPDYYSNLFGTYLILPKLINR
jgi:hypothetical protein